MLKRLCIVTAILAVSLGSVQAAGTISFSLSQQFDEHGKPLSGCKFYTIQAGTVATPQNAYQDAALTIALPNPITCDAAGRLPQFFLADGSIKVRLTDKNGVQQIVADNILVIGPSSGGGGGGGSVDPTTVAATGDIKSAYGTGSISGWVRLNGRTIGSSTSGATERANADCQALFVYLWGADASLTVSGGRGVSAAADWAANKTITLPDARGRVLASLDDMGASAAGRLTASYFGSNATVLGAANGSESVTMALSNLIRHDHTVFLHDPGHTHSQTNPGGAVDSSFGVGFSSGGVYHTTPITLSTNTTGITLWSDGAGAGSQNHVGMTGSATPTPMRTVQPTILVTTYIKL